jgi:hypothetical protein
LKLGLAFWGIPPNMKKTSTAPEVRQTLVKTRPDFV